MSWVAVASSMALLSAPALQARPADSPNLAAPAAVLEDEEAEAIAAAAWQITGGNARRWVWISGRTVSFACESAEATGFALGGCSGMRTRDQSPAETLSWVRRSIGGVSEALTATLLDRGSESVAIVKPLPMPVQQHLWSPGDAGSTPPESDAPDFALYPSRVAFAADRLSALLYLGIVSWTDSSASFGEYVYLERSDGKWIVKGHARLWKFGS
jgi:hypothetical protein